MNKLIEYNELANEFNKAIPDTHDTTKLRTNDSEGGNMGRNYIAKEVFKQFKKRIDDKLDSLPSRMVDKMDTKIGGLETKQTKWFVGITVSTTIGGLSSIVGAIGLVVNMFI